jgi:hypothetical protein
VREVNTFELLIAAADGKAVVTEKKAGEIIGGVSIKRLRNLRSEGKELIPTMQIGGRRFVCITDLAEFVDRQRAGATPTAPQQKFSSSPKRRAVGRPKKVVKTKRIAKISGDADHEQ